MFSLTSRSAKTWRRTSQRRVAYRSAIIQGTYSNQLGVSMTSGSKVMAHYVIFTKVVTLTLTVTRLLPKNFARVLLPEYISCKKNQKDRTSSVACRAFKDGQTDGQTVVTNILCKNLRFCKVTNRGDQYTLQKSTILQNNKQTKNKSINQAINTY